jgi:hypothetical protein
VIARAIKRTIGALFGNAWREIRDGASDAGTPLTPVSGPLYESPSMQAPKPDYSHVYKARMRAEREKRGLPPLKELEP